jgi:hypothetical protein
MMQSIDEHQEIPKGEATVMPVRGLRKQCRVRNLTAKCPLEAEGKEPGILWILEKSDQC